MVKNPNWQEADQLAILQAWPRSWTRDYREQIQLVSGRMERLNPGPPDYNIYQRPKPLGHAASSNVVTYGICEIYWSPNFRRTNRQEIILKKVTTFLSLSIYSFQELRSRLFCLYQYIIFKNWGHDFFSVSIYYFQELRSRLFCLYTCFWWSFIHLQYK